MYAVRADAVTFILRSSLGVRSARFVHEGRHQDGTLVYTAYEQCEYVEKDADSATSILYWLREAFTLYATEE